MSVWESEDGWCCLKCFAGCSRDDILSAMGLRVRDLAINGFTRNPEWEQRKRDQDRLTVLDTREGAYIWNQYLDPKNRAYWRAAELKTLAEIVELRNRMYPNEAANIRRNEIAQHLITEYGIEELWNCLPESLFTLPHNLSR